MNNNNFSTRGKRIPWIDFQRGIAILLMIPANFAPLFNEPHPLWFRFITSFAAPMFIMLSTGIVVLNEKTHDLVYYLKRGSIIMGYGVLIDVFLNNRFPFSGVDVLYLIGLATPIVYMARQCSTSKLIGIGVVFFITALLLRQLLGYSHFPLEVGFKDISWRLLSRILKGWLIDDWFPIFPWLGYAFFGKAFFRIMFTHNDQKMLKNLLIFAIFATIIGLTLLFLKVNWIDNLTNQGIIATRFGYSEIFYPPTAGFMLTSLGVVLLVSWVSRKLCALKISHIICTFGRYSMLIYILHQIIEVFVAEPLVNLSGSEMVNGKWFFILILLPVLICLYLTCLLITYLKQYYRPSSLILQILIGK